MTPLSSHLIDIVFSVLLAAAIAWLLGGNMALLLAVIVVLAFWLMRHLMYLHKLRRWLASPKLRLIPQGRGVWQDVFDTLLRQAKSRKKRKQKIAEALQRFNRAAEAIPNGVMILDAHHRIEWLNQLAMAHLNLNDGDKGGILHNVVRVPEFHAFLQQPLNEVQTFHLTLNDNRQRVRILLLIRTPFEHDSQLLISQDITAAEQLNATRTAFIANVSHELRTPLTVINGFLETLADMPELPVAQQQEFIALMRQEGARMQDLLADLLTLSHLENRQMGSVEHHLIDLSALCQQVAQAAMALSQAQHRFEIDITEGMYLQGIQQDLYSALSNIAFNAVHYTPKGGIIQMVLRSQQHASGQLMAYFAVTDTGAGIAPEHLPHLTERFYRVDSARLLHHGGSGLGLAITKHALAEHQATLEIHSVLGQGSTFSVELPLDEQKV